MSIPTLNDTGVLEGSIRALQEMLENTKSLREANKKKFSELTGDANYYTYEWPIRLEFDYQPYEEATHNTPSSDARATLTAAYLFGQDVTDIVSLDQAWVSDMEEQYVENYGTYQRDLADDHGDYLVNRMKEEGE